MNKKRYPRAFCEGICMMNERLYVCAPYTPCLREKMFRLSDALNVTFSCAGIVMASLVAGLMPCRSGTLFTRKRPKSGMATSLSPSVRVSAMVPRTALTYLAASAFEMPVFSATMAVSCVLFIKFWFLFITYNVVQIYKKNTYRLCLWRCFFSHFRFSNI